MRQLGEVHAWTDTQCFIGLISFVKLCCLDLPQQAPLDDEDTPAQPGGVPPAAPPTHTDRSVNSDSGNVNPVQAAGEKSGNDDGSSVGTSTESSNASWMDMDGPSSARSFADNLLGLVPANLLAGCTADLAAQAVPSLAEGAPSTARQFRNDKEIHLVVREIAKTYEFKTLGKADLPTEVDRLCAFNTVPAKDKELLKFLLKSYNTAHASTTLQLNLVLASFTQVQDEASDWADGGSDDPFTLERYAPQAWALLQVLIASLTYPVVKLCVELVNLISSCYAMSKVPAITPFTPVSNLVRVEIDQAALLKKRTEEMATLALMNPPTKKARTDAPFSGRATAPTRGSGQRTRGSSNARADTTRGQRGRGAHRHENRSYHREVTGEADPEPGDGGPSDGQDSRRGRGRGGRGTRGGRGGGRGSERGGRGRGYNAQRP